MMNHKFKRKKFFRANDDFNFCKVLKSGQRKASQSTSDLNHNPTIVKNTIKRVFKRFYCPYLITILRLNLLSTKISPKVTFSSDLIGFQLSLRRKWD